MKGTIIQMPNPTYLKRRSKKDKNRLNDVYELAKLTGETVNPFKHRDHRSKKASIKEQMEKVKLYKKKKEKLKNNDKQNEFIGSSTIGIVDKDIRH